MIQSTNSSKNLLLKIESGRVSPDTVIDNAQQPFFKDGTIISPTNEVQDLKNQVHVKGNKEGLVYLPLCAKPSFIGMIEENPNLLLDYIKHSLASTDKDILIFIADGDVMSHALTALGNSKKRADRLTTKVSARIRSKVDIAVEKLNNNRIKGVVHWHDIVNDKEFCDVLTILENVMAHDCDTLPVDAVEMIHFHIKTLVKNLFTQRLEKARKAGSNITNVFIDDGLELHPDKKYQKRYKHLETACLLEISSILTGFFHDGQTFTEMYYLTNDPQGMTYISACIQEIRKALLYAKVESKECPLTEYASIQHGITFVKFD